MFIMNVFVVIRSILLIFTLYIGLILNNAFQQYFTNQVFISTLMLCLVLTELVSYAYKIVLENPPGLSVYVFMLALSLVTIMTFPFLLLYVLLLSVLVLYLMSVTFFSTFFTISDQMQISFKACGSENPNFHLYEKKGLIFSNYFLVYDRSLTFLSPEDKRNFFDLLRSHNGLFQYNSSTAVSFTLLAKGFRFSPFTKNNLIRAGNDLEKMTLNIFAK